jgi:CubicO group peptidase (beta-lactamase class C family)
MIAHLSIPAIDKTPHLPTSLSQKNVTDLLRRDLGFKGISFTDALEMQGVAKYYPQGDAAVKSLLAGNDMLCLPGDVPKAINRIQSAITKGVLDSTDIINRVKKVLLVKYNLGLNHPPVIDTTNLYNDLNKDVNALKSKVARNAITLLRMKDSFVFPLSANKKIAYVGVGAADTTALGLLLAIENYADVFLMDYNADATIANSILQKVSNGYDEVIIGVHHFNKYPARNFGLTTTALNLIKDLQSSTHAITMVFGNPYALKNFCDADNLVECYEDDPLFQQAAYEWLNGGFVAQGKLPVTVCDAFHYGDGITDYGLQQLAHASPEAVGMDSAKLYSQIDSIANDAIAKHATPGCVVLVAKDNKIVMDKAYGYLTYNKQQPVDTNTIYDLASVTIISSTLLSVMRLSDEGKLDINKTLGDYLPWVRGSNKSDLVLKDVLLHQAGLVAYIPFYKETLDAQGNPNPNIYHRFPDSIYSVHVAANMWMRKDWIDTIYERILQSKLELPIRYIYSDNDFIFLAKVVEQITGMTLDEYAAKTFYKPMHLYNTTFKPYEHIPINNIAPTENEQQFREQLIRSYVHDPGSAMFGGVAGHAGLFSNVHDLAILYSMLLNGGEWDGVHYIKKETIDYFTQYHSDISRRAYGYDKPEKDNATRKEPYPCIDASPLAYGHSGFTGIWVWNDPKYNLEFIFLSNHVNPEGGANTRLITMNVRGKILEAVYQAMLNK